MGPSRYVAVIVLLVLPPLARTQQFSRVVIKPSTSSSPGASRLQVLPSGELIGHSIIVAELISLAYAVPVNPSPRIAGLPEWADFQRFDIEAKPPESLQLNMKALPAQRRTIELLLRHLLSDYFGLVLRAKTVITPVYLLMLSKKGIRLTRSTISTRDCILDTGPDGCHSFVSGFGHPLIATAVDMSDLAHYLENWTDLPMVDRTATLGLFAMHSQGWRPMKLPPPPPGATGTGAEFASLSPLPAVLSGFGLQMHRWKESVSFYVVERLNQPNAR